MKQKSLLHRLIAPIGHPVKQYFVERKAEEMQKRLCTVCFFLAKHQGKEANFLSWSNGTL